MNNFFTSSEKKFLKDINFENHYVGHSVIKPVDAESFHKRKDIKERFEEKNECFDMEVL